MKKIRLVAIDLDGTLLNSHSRVSEGDAAALTLALQSGLTIVLASGKPYAALAPLVRRFVLTAPQIALNGGLVYDPVQGKTLLQHSFSAAASNELIAELQRAGIPLVVYGAQRSYAASKLPQLDHLLAIGEPQPLIRAELAGEEAVLKVLTFTSADDLPRETWLKSLGKGKITVVRTSPALLEFIPATGGKGSALDYVAGSLAFKREEIAAIGDSENDYSLLQSAGLPLAMGNAAPKLKETACRVVADNDHCGVAEALSYIMQL